jgi:hypothetical protein
MRLAQGRSCVDAVTGREEDFAVYVRVNNYSIQQSYFLHGGAEGAKREKDLLPNCNPSSRGL